MAKSRLEINFLRLLEETQQIANGNVTKDWKFEKENQSLLILYGSQTGTAQEKAYMIGKICLQYFFLGKVKALNDITIDTLQSANLAVFIVATTGQGDDPDNMKSFFQTLWTSRKDRQLLKNLSYSVIGLGDSTYMKFNYSAKRLNKLLSVVGAKPLFDIALADDQHDLGPDYVIENWLKVFRKFLIERLPSGIQPITSPILLQPKYNVIYENQLTNRKVSENFHYSSLDLNKRITSPDHFQDVRLVEFNISGSNFSYCPGDVLQVQPQNSKEDVNEFLSIVGLDGDKVFFLEPNDCDINLPELHVLPQPSNIRQCVENYFDIMHVPTRGFFELLFLFSEDEQEKEKFLELSLPEGQQEYYNYCTRPKRSILEVLADFPCTNKKIPFEYLFDLIPPIKPRDYSIASSILTNSCKVQILMAVVNYKTILKRPRLGLCSNWLISLPLGANVWLSMKKGTLNFPDDSSTPVVMIGPGTGCAPFRSYIQERVNKGDCRNIFMIFGCRSASKDYFFKDEWESNTQLGLLCAFSRDQDDKVYVQHIMRDNYQTLWKIINNGAMVYFAGNAKRTPIDVYEALEYICQKGALIPDQKIGTYMKNNFDRRYQTETWA